MFNDKNEDLMVTCVIYPVPNIICTVTKIVQDENVSGIK